MMHRFQKALAAALSVLLLFSCSVDQLVDVAEQMKNNLWGVEETDASSVAAITENTETETAEVSTETDEDGNTTISVSLGDISLTVTLDGEYSIDLDSVTIVSPISDSDLQTLALALEEASQEALSEVFEQEASEELAEAVTSTCSLIADILEEYDVDELLEDSGLSDDIIEAVDTILDELCRYAEEDITVTQGDVLMVQLITSTVYSLAEALTEDGSEIVISSEDLDDDTLDNILDAASSTAGDILGYVSVLVNVSSVISECDSSETELAGGISDLYSAVAPYLDDYLNDEEE